MSCAVVAVADPDILLLLALTEDTPEVRAAVARVIKLILTLMETLVLQIPEAVGEVDLTMLVMAVVAARVLL
jgi:hypothetical protein